MREQVASEASAQRQYQQIKLAMDVHAASMVVVRRVDANRAVLQIERASVQLAAK